MMKQNRTFFICNRERCEKCYPECKYTTSLFYSKYEDHTDFDTDEHGNQWEIERSSDEDHS